ncbi:MAG TPA: hypothetical protein VMX15_06135 [Candidatus Heimdallarchaeota archaeon]|nr:hypothetical protein [Candidatus Heimdallarchaeota archaeon]
MIYSPNMDEVSKTLKTVLEGYAKFLRDRDLAPPKHQPHLARCELRTRDVCVVYTHDS